MAVAAHLYSIRKLTASGETQMALHKGLLNGGFHLAECEKHFHDHDETWIILKGKGIGFWIDHTGTARNSSSKRVMYG
jgi:mannose-6-phosphate isomerase-like protein (cupin superfamily)